MPSPAPGGHRDEGPKLSAVDWARRLYAPATLAAITAVLSVVAYEAAFSTFLAVDDEGYVIVSMRLFNAGQALYEEVYSQYGPGLFTLVGGLIDLVGLPLTSDGARWFNLTVWLATTLGAGLVIWRMTRSLAISAVGLLFVFFVLSVDANEPLHPGATLALLLVAMVAAAAFVVPRHPALGLGLLGVTATAAISIKVNVGGFAIAALVWALVASVPALRRWRLLLGAVGVAFVAVPWVLTADLLGDGSTQRYATLVSAGALALVVVSRAQADDRPAARDLLWLAVGAGATLLVVAAVPILRGTSPAELIDGWVIRPAETPERQFAAAAFHVATFFWGFAGVATALVTATALAAGRNPGRRAGVLVAVARIVFGVAIWLGLTGPLFGLPPELTRSLFVATPFVWLIAVAPARAAFPNQFARTLLAGLAILQTLHAFPVGGSQLAWSQFLLILVAAVCVADGIAGLRPAGTVGARGRVAWAHAGTVAVLGVGAWFCLGPLGDYVDRTRDGYATGDAPGVKGGERLRIDPLQAEELRAVTQTLGARCRTYVSLPGLNSFYLFTGMEPPTVLSGPWPHFLTAEEQARIVEEVEEIPSLCALRRPESATFWASLSGHTIPELPLVRFIDEEFEPLTQLGRYVVEVRSDPREDDPR